MEYIALFAIAVIPGAAMTVYFQKKDHIQPEPWNVILISFIVGAIIVLPIGILESFILSDEETTGTALSMFAPIFFKNALPEELGKIIVFLLIAFRSKHFDELMDGLVYGAAAAAGFATFENIFYVLDNGFLTGIVRAILSVPMHIFAGAMSGYWIARIRFNKTPLLIAIFAGPFMAVLAHTLFNVGMFASASEHGAWFLMGFVVVLLQLIACILHIRRGLKESVSIISRPEPDRQAREQQRSWSSLTVLATLCYLLAIVSAIVGFFFMLGVIGLAIDGDFQKYGTVKTVILIMLVLIPVGGSPFFWFLGRRFHGN